MMAATPERSFGDVSDDETETDIGVRYLGTHMVERRCPRPGKR